MTQSDQSNSGVSDTPRTAVERGADAAMRAAEISLDAEGCSVRKMFVLLYAGDVPVGELDCTSAGIGYDDAADLLSELFGHFAGAMKSLGCEVKLVPLGKG